MPKNRGFADLHFTTYFFDTKSVVSNWNKCAKIGGEINEGILQIQSYWKQWPHALGENGRTKSRKEKWNNIIDAHRLRLYNKVVSKS